MHQRTSSVTRPGRQKLGPDDRRSSRPETDGPTCRRTNVVLSLGTSRCSTRCRLPVVRASKAGGDGIPKQEPVSQEETAARRGPKEGLADVLETSHGRTGTADPGLTSATLQACPFWDASAGPSWLRSRPSVVRRSPGDPVFTAAVSSSHSRDEPRIAVWVRVTPVPRRTAF